MERIHEAVNSKNIFDIQNFVRAGDDINQYDAQFGQTPLHKSAAAGDVDLTQQLISMGAQLNLKDRYGRTPLHLSALYGMSYTTSELIRARADINAMDREGRTPLMCSILYSMRGTATLLIRAGAYLHSRDCDGKTAIDLIKARKHLLQDLIQLGVIKIWDLGNLNAEADAKRKALDMMSDHISSQISEKQKELECPVCLLEPKSAVPIYRCRYEHMVCATCYDKMFVKKCAVCRVPYSRPDHSPKRFRSMEKLREEVTRLREKNAYIQLKKASFR